MSKPLTQAQIKRAKKLLPEYIAGAIRCGHIPKFREWRHLPYEKMTRAERNMAFCERYCVAPEGKLRGKKILIADFQEAFFRSVFDSPRRVRRAYLSIARKNSKTATIALILLCFLVGPEAIQNARMNSGARSRKQAAEVFNYAAKMIKFNPELSGLTRIVDSGKKIIGLAMSTEYEALSAEGSTAHGGSPLLAILDEVGQIKGPQDDFVDAIETSQGAYEGESLLIAISTQAPTDAALFSKWLDTAELGDDDSIVSHLYTAPEECELDDEKAWRAANPAMGLFRSKSDIEGQARDAMANPSAESRFRVLTLNQRQNMVASFVSKTSWKACGSEPLAFGDEPIYGGLDLSLTTDLTALILTFRRDDVLSAHAFFWMPHDTVKMRAKEDHAAYDVWVKQGLIRTTPGVVLDYDFIARDLGEICKDLNIKMIGFDPWKMQSLKKALDDQEISVPLIEHGQGYKSMSPALDLLEVDILKSKLAHGNNPVLAMCAANAVVRPDPSGNRKLDKSRSTGRIDGMQALAMARGTEIKVVEDDTNVYEARGLRVL